LHPPQGYQIGIAAMKVKVSVKVASNLKSLVDRNVGQTIELSAKEGDSVHMLKTKIMESQMIAFREQDLKLDGKVLEETVSLEESGIVDGSTVELSIRSCESELISALLELLQNKELSLEELAMLYCYKNGVSINQVLQSLGIEERFANFVSKRVEFLCKGGRVSVARARPPPGLTLTAPAPAPKPSTASKVWPTVSTEKPLVLPSPVKLSEENNGDAYLDLHTKISGRAFSSKATQALNDITAAVSDKLFLNVDHVVRGGSVGRGTVIGGATDAEIVFFLKDLPVAGQLKWLPALHKAVVGVLNECLSASHGVEDVVAEADSVKFNVRGVVSVDLKFVPVFDSLAEVHQALQHSEADTRRRLGCALLKERTHFIAKQPGQVKVTMRLLKWWRDQQQWSSVSTRPSDDLVELLVVHSACLTKPQDQQTAVTNVLGLMSRFTELHVTWTNYYKKSDIWDPLLNHQPLLMDPVNPFLNVADPQMFDHRELMTYAAQTHFFW
jgi:hypothetical protein